MNPPPKQVGTAFLLLPSTFRTSPPPLLTLTIITPHSAYAAYPSPPSALPARSDIHTGPELAAQVERSSFQGVHRWRSMETQLCPKQNATRLA